MRNIFDETKCLWVEATGDLLQLKKNDLVSTGFKNLDHEVFRLHRGDLVIVAGRPAMGKTSLAVSIACRSATEFGTGVAYYATELPERALAGRMLRIQSNLIEQRTEGISDHDMIHKAADALSNQRIALRYMPIFNMERMKSELSDSDKVDLLIIDSLDGIKNTAEGFPSSDSAERILQIKDFSKKTNIATILLSNIGRGPENRTPHFPTLTDLPEAEMMIDQADAIWLLYRERYYDRTCLDSTASIILAHSKYAELISTMLSFDEELQGFRDN